MSATAAMDARTLLGLLGRERRRLRRTREAAPRHAECQARFGPPGRARPRRQSQSEGAWRGRRPSTWAPLRRASPQPTHPYTSPALDEPNWIFYDELESVAAGWGDCGRQKPQRFIRAFRALHISRSSTRLSPSDPSAQLLRVRSGQTLPRPSTSNTMLTAPFQSLSPYLHARDSPPLSTRGSVFRREMPAVAKASGGGTALPHL
eukprot:COSAG06_NODE_309_length_17782_cov_49.326698_15_plen_205_part_00